MAGKTQTNPINSLADAGKTAAAVQRALATAQLHMIGAAIGLPLVRVTQHESGVSMEVRCG